MQKGHSHIRIAGSTVGLVGATVRAHVRLVGQRDYTDGGVCVVSASGTFTWDRRANRKAYVYFTAEPGVRSNRVVIPPDRPRAARLFLLHRGTP